MDGTKPESQIIFDLPTAYAFFAENPDETLSLVGDRVRALAARWNEANGLKVIDLNGFLKIVLSKILFHTNVRAHTHAHTHTVV